MTEGVDSSVPGTPGVSGAIKDAVGAVRKYFAGKANEIQQGRQQTEDAVVNGAAGKEDTRIDGHEVDADGS